MIPFPLPFHPDQLELTESCEALVSGDHGEGDQASSFPQRERAREGHRGVCAGVE